MQGPILRLTRSQVREVDRRAIEEYHIPGIVLMENAALHATEVAWEMLGGRAGGVVIVCGAGNNGGDGLAIARHLHNRGAEVRIIAASRNFKGDAEINWNIVSTMKLPVQGLEKATGLLKPGGADLLIDALFGTGLTRAIEGELAQLVELMNASTIPILSIDLPSGLDCDSGEPLSAACVQATRTVTFVAEKAGFANPGSRRYTGAVTTADIGCPREIVMDIFREVHAEGGEEGDRNIRDKK